MEPSRPISRFRHAPGSHRKSYSTYQPNLCTEPFPHHPPHPLSDASPQAAADTLLVLAHALGDSSSITDVQYASDSIIPTFLALSYFNMTARAFRLLLFHPPGAPPTPPPLAHARAASSSPWLPPLTPLPPLTTADLPATACFHHVLVGHESAFRLTSQSDAVRGVALRGLRDAVLRHCDAEPSAAAGILRINMYTQSSIAADDACTFSEVLNVVASGAALSCLNVDALDTFAAAARAVSSAHLHIVPASLPSALMMLLARESSVVFCVHAIGNNPE